VLFIDGTPPLIIGGQSLCPLVALRDILHRRATLVANGGIAEIDMPTSIAGGDARDPEPT